MMKSVKHHFRGDGLRSIMVRAVTGSAGVRIAGMGFAFLVGVQLARGLGSAGYGVYGIAMSIVALLTVPTEFGIPQLIVREVSAAKVRSDWGQIRGLLFWSTQVSCSIAAAIGASVLAWLLLSGQGAGLELGRTLMFGVLLIPFVAITNIRSAVLRGLQRIVVGQVPDTVVRPAAFSLLLLIVTSANGMLSPSKAMGLGVVAAATAMVVATALLRREAPPQLATAAATGSRAKWWAGAIPMAMTEGMRVLQAHIVILVIGMMSTVAAVGIFRVASSIALLISVPITLLNIVTAPLVARLFAEGDRQKLQRLLSSTSLAMFGGTLLLTMPFLIAGPALLTRVFGSEFADADIILLVLAAGVTLNAFFGANATLLNMAGQAKRVTRSSLISLLSLSVLLPLMLAWLDSSGAALASVSALSIWNLLMWRDAKQILGFDTTFLSLLTSSRSAKS